MGGPVVQLLWRHHPELVAGGGAEGVVDGLEAIEIEQGHSDGFPLLACTVQQRRGAPQEFGAVEQARQVVHGRLAVQ